jgi:dipeptidyl aminopeptidase/acylaminoacyl peptidase
MFKKIIFLLFVVMLVIFRCSDNKNYNTYLIFKGDSSHMPVWYSTDEFIIFLYNYDVASINPDGQNFNILLSGAEKINSVSDDGYIIFDTSSDVNSKDMYYFKPGSDPVKFPFKGFCASVYGNLSGKYNIVYLYDDNEETLGWSIYIADINGSTPKKIIGEGYFYDPAWSPDGRKIVYTKYNNWSSKNAGTSYSPDDTSNYNICIYNLEIESMSILYTYDEISCPRFSPDGNYITFAAPSENQNISQNVVWLIKTSGGDPWQVTEYPYEPGRDTHGVYYLSWSPDGKWIVYDMGTEGELWKVHVFK